MKIRVNPHTVEIVKEQTEPINEREIKVSKCEFEFDEAITSEFVKEAYFTLNGNTYKMIVENNECDYPSEVLAQKGTLEIGVVAFLVENETEIKRYNPSPDYFESWVGSLKSAENSEPITPSEMEQFEQELQEGLNEIDDKIDEIDDKIEEVNTAITETNNLDLDVEKSGKVATVTLTKKDATEKVVTLSDGTNLMFNWQGTSLGIKTDEDADYTYVDLQGVQGETGPMGAPFTIKKTYSSVAEMNADFDNMELGDYVMIASTVEIEDNAKLYTRGESQWIFITDFSGATGIQGPTGVTPNIQIGTVVSGDSPSVTRSGTNENPVLNFTLVKGDTGATGQTGPTGNGIASITKTSTSGLVDTYTITFTSGNTTTFNVTNGNGIDHISLTSQSGATKVYTIYYTDGNTTTFTVQDGEVTQEVFDEEVERLKMVYNAMPKVSGEGTDLTLNNTAECPVYDIELSPSELEQETTTGKNLLNIPDGTYTDNGITAVAKDGEITLNGTATAVSVVYVRNVNISVSAEAYTWSANNSVANNVILRFDTNVMPGILNEINKAITQTFESATTLTNFAIRTSEGTTLTDFKIKPQFEKGSSATNWEPYTGGSTPRPDYPQEIHTVSGDNSVVVRNKNLFDNTYSRESQYLRDDGTIGNQANYNISNFINVRPNTTYTLSANLGSSSLGGSASLCQYDDENNFIKGSRYSNRTVLTITTETNTKKIMFAYRTDASDYQLEENSSATTYVPHQEQTYPISLGDLEYCKIGDYEDEFMKPSDKNMVNVSATNQIVFSNSYNNFTLSNGILTTSGNTLVGYKVKVTPNTQYTAQLFGTLSGGTNALRIREYPVEPTDWDTNLIIQNVTTITNNTKSSLTVTTSASTEWVLFVIYSNTSGLVCRDMQLEKGSMTEYEPYNNGKWYLKKNIGKVVLDGSNDENWGIQETGTSNWFYRLAYTTNVGDISQYKPLSNYYKYAGISTTNTYQGIGVTSGYFRIRYGTEDTIANFKTWLSTHNVVVYYPISTPTYTLLSDTLQTQLDNLSKAITYQDQTNVSQTNNDLPFVIKLSAIRDLSGIFEEI